MKIGDYKPPFTYFGGKSRVADVVWRAIGPDVANYVEPFFGSGAVLFLRPGGADGIETVNDADGFVANFWRAMRADVDAVAEYADWPVNEADLHARHLWLLGQRARITEALMGDPDFYDAKAAGWWCWGINCWVPGGFCSGKGPWHSVDGVMMKGENDGSGVNAGQGVSRCRPHLGSAGQGVNRKRGALRECLGDFAARLARVRVCCGDWGRVCTPSVTFGHGPTGVFLDPPYADTAGRTSNLYAVDCEQVAHRVREWAIEAGRNPLMRIVLAGYEGEHSMPGDWRVHEGKARGGYASLGDGDGRDNSTRERLWFSPACVAPEAGLFGRGT